VNLTQPEGERFRKLAGECVQAMDQAMRSIRPGQTEWQIAARLAMETETRGVQPVCLLVATDERIFSYRHPLPKDKTMEHYAMVVLCGRKWGLVCSLTRLVHFGPLSEEVRHKAKSVAQVDAVMIANTRPGRTLGEIFALGQAAYSRAGFPDEWQMHHQGGSAGYEAREFVAVPGMDERVAAGQVYAWNPSIRGTKSEDTILVSDSGNEILTVIPGWPVVTVQADGQTLLRPAILEM
jgi:antitoxin VapB